MPVGRYIICSIVLLVLAYVTYKASLGDIRPDNYDFAVSPNEIKQLVRHYSKLGADTNNVLPVLGIITHRRTDLLARCLMSIDIPVTMLVIIQNGESEATKELIREIKEKGIKLEYLEYPDNAGKAGSYNTILNTNRAVPFWLIADDHIVFEPGSLAKMAAHAKTFSKDLDDGRTNKALLFPGEFLFSTIWSCFVLLQGAVRHVGEFDTNFWPDGHEGYDYIVRLSRMGLWVQNMTDVAVHVSDTKPEDVSPEIQYQQQRHENGRPYFALKWGHAETVGVFDMEGHWNQRCKRRVCESATPVLYRTPFNDAKLSVTYYNADQEYRKCVYRGPGPCRYDVSRLPRPQAVPPGSFDGIRWIPSAAKKQPDIEPQKRFVYLVQGARVRVMDPPLYESEDRDVLWLTYREKGGQVWYPKSSWTQGRNRLLDAAMAKAVQMPNGGYLYYIFMDSDVILRTRKDKRLLYRDDLPENPYERFEQFLIDWEPAVGTVAYWWTLYDPTKFSIHHNNDAVFSAHHRETLSFGLPYVEDLDCRSWYYSQHIMNSINAMLYNTRRVQCNAMEARNEEHVALYKREMTWITPRCYARTAVKPSSPLFTQTFVVDPNPAYTDGQPTKRGNVSYIVPEEYIREHFDAEHPVVQRALQFRNRVAVQHILNASMKVAPRTFVEDHRVCSPTGPDVKRCFNTECPEGVKNTCAASRSLTRP